MIRYLFLPTILVAIIAYYVFTIKQDLTGQDKLNKTINSIQFNTLLIKFNDTLGQRTTTKVYSSDISKTALATSIREAVEAEWPRILTGSVVEKWAALRWSLWQLATSSHWPILADVLHLNCNNSSEFSVFLPASERDRGGMLSNAGQGIPNPSVISEMYFADFLADLHNSTRSRYLYSTNFRVFESVAKVEADTTWKDFRIIEHAATAFNISVTMIAPQLLLMFPGGALQARYSEYHVMRSQLHGVGRYTLYPPEHLRDLYLFPYVHVSHQQSQVNAYDATSTATGSRFPRYKKVRPLEATLLPGQVLYIPPYWTVHSEAPDSIFVALDVLSASHEQLTLAMAEQVPLPVPSGQSRDERIVSAQVYLAHVLSRTKGLASIKKYSAALYASRFAALYPRQGLFVQRSGFDCFKGDLDRRHAVLDKLDKEQIMGGAARVAAIVNDQTVSDAVRWLWMGNYVEQIARWAMGDAEGVPLFVLQCLDMEGKIEIENEQEQEGPPVVTMNPQLDE